jgi:hypothetical protein
VAIRPEPEGKAAQPLPGPTSLTVVTGNGYRIEVGESFVPQTLARLLSTLERL